MAELLRVLIVDDEPLVRQGLAAALADQRVSIVGEARNGVEALERIEDLAPDLVFLDVEMPEMNGLEVLRALAGGPVPGIVFVTAFDRYAVDAFEHHAIDYLLKPFDTDRVGVALARARQRLAAGRVTADQVARLLQQFGGSGPRRFIPVRNGSRVVLVKPADIDWIEAAGNYVRLYVGPTRHVVRSTLADLEAELDPAQFVRVHRSAIANLDRIREVQSLASGDFQLVLANGARVPMSRRFRKTVENRIGKAL